MNDLINYHDSTDFDKEKWTATSMKNHFIETYRKVHHAGGAIPWTLKDQVLLSRVMDEYKKREELADLILYWHLNTPKSSVACQFSNFYSLRHRIYEKMMKSSNEYEWDN